MYQEKTREKHWVLRMLFVAILLVLFLAVKSYSQTTGYSSSLPEAALHTYSVSKEYTSIIKRPFSEHKATKAASSVLWEQSWFKIFMYSFCGMCLVLVQTMRVKKIINMKKSFSGRLAEKDEEISHQTKNIKAQAESNHDLKGNCDSLQSQLKLQIDRAERAEKAKNSFLTMISYGVRTPLNGLLGTAALLLDTNLTEEQKDYTFTINSCGQNLLAAVNDMFDYAKIESGEVKLEEKEFNLRRTVEDVMEVFSNKASESDLDFVYRMGKDVPVQIVGDSFRLKQVLINLVANALNFSKQVEDIFIDVKVSSLEESNCELSFEVHNTGVGINYDSAVSMFKSFSKADYSSTTQYGGTGLGLANCENLVRLMGGSISMESHRGKGSTFSFVMKTKISQNRFQANEIFDTEMLDGKNILLVDNHLNNLMVIREQLEDWKMNVTLVDSGYAGLKLLTHPESFDLVITDLKMPGFDGIQMAQAVKKLYQDMPVMLLAPLANDHWKKDEHLFAASVVKPIKQSALYKSLVKSLQITQKPLIESDDDSQTISAEFSAKYPLRILIAEDNIINQKLTLRVLGKLGYNAKVVSNGREALDEIKVNDHDLIFMDVQMPILNGFETTIQIRQQDRIQPTIVAMTANALQGDREDCIRAGMDDYISKPINIEELVVVLKKWAKQLKIDRQFRFLAQA